MAFFFFFFSLVFNMQLLFFQHFPTYILEMLCKLSFILTEFSGQTTVRMVYGHSWCVQDSMCVCVCVCVSQSCCGLIGSSGRDVPSHWFSDCRRFERALDSRTVGDEGAVSNCQRHDVTPQTRLEPSACSIGSSRHTDRQTDCQGILVTGLDQTVSWSERLGKRNVAVSEFQLLRAWQAAHCRLRACVCVRVCVWHCRSGATFRIGLCNTT
jgi:hypothetical protein